MPISAIVQGMLATITVTQAQVAEASERVNTARSDLKAFDRHVAVLKRKLEQQLREAALIETGEDGVTAARDSITDDEIALDLGVSGKTVSRIAKRDPKFPRAFRYGGKRGAKNRRKRHEYQAWRRQRELTAS
jgi:hypothetical protein